MHGQRESAKAGGANPKIIKHEVVSEETVKQLFGGEYVGIKWEP